MGKSIGQIGYEAYSTFTGNKTYNGNEMPVWDDLGPAVQGAWSAAAMAIARHDREDRDLCSTSVDVEG